MTANQTHLYRWIVIVHKQHKGPLTHSELMTLLSEGVLGPNDVACRVELKNQKENSGWKFIYQFDELGIPKQAEVATVASSHAVAKPESVPEIPMLPSESDRKGYIGDEALKREVFAALPGDLFELALTQNRKAEPSQMETSSTGERPRPKLSSSSDSERADSIAPKLWLGLIALLFIFVAVHYYPSSPAAHSTPTPMPKPPSGHTATEDKAPTEAGPMWGPVRHRKSRAKPAED